MNQIERLFVDLAESYQSERIAQRRFQQTGKYTVSKAKAEDEIRDAALARVLDASAAMEGKQAVHIMPKEIDQLKAAGFQVKTDPETGAFNVSDPVASQGRNGDTRVAMVDDWGASFLKAKGGAGTINPVTGMREFFDVGDGSAGDTGGMGGAAGDASPADNASDPTDGGVNGVDDGSEDAPGAEASSPGFGGHDPNNPTDVTDTDVAGAVAAAGGDPFSAGQVAQHKAYGLPATVNTVQALQEHVHARHEHNPTPAQNAMNMATHKGFAAANPGVATGMNVGMALAGMAVPGVGIVGAIGNIANAATGQPSVGLSGLASSIGVDIPGLGSIAADLGIDISSVGVDLDGIASDVTDAINEVFGGDVSGDGGGEPGGSQEYGDGDEDKTSITDPESNQDESDGSVLLEVILAILSQNSGSTGTPLDWRF